MTINEKSILGYYYKWMFNGKLTENFCTLFWNTLLSLCLLPLTLPAFLASLVFDKDIWCSKLFGKSFNGFITYIGIIAVFFFGIASFEKIFGEIWRTWGFWQVMGAALVGFIGLAITIVLVIVTIAGICVGVHYTHKRIFSKKVVHNMIDEDGHEYTSTYYEPKEIKAIILWNTIRNKYCTKIEWK